MEYTEGEWKASHPLDDIAYFGNKEGTIARIQWFAGIPVKEQKANIQLIATTPDMYEALKAIDDYLSAPYPKNMPLKQIAADKLVSALAKAEGK